MQRGSRTAETATESGQPRKNIPPDPLAKFKEIVGRVATADGTRLHKFTEPQWAELSLEVLRLKLKEAQLEDEFSDLNHKGTREAVAEIESQGGAAPDEVPGVGADAEKPAPRGQRQGSSPLKLE